IPNQNQRKMSLPRAPENCRNITKSRANLTHGLHQVGFPSYWLSYQSHRINDKRSYLSFRMKHTETVLVCPVRFSFCLLLFFIGLDLLLFAFNLLSPFL